MIRFSKRTEYAILAVQYIATNNPKLVSAKIMSEDLNIPFEFLSKSLQKLMKYGLIESVKGKNGGYKLNRNPDDISLTDIINAIEGKGYSSIVECFTFEDRLTCGRVGQCTIRNLMKNINKRVNSIFNSVTLKELINLEQNNEKN